MKTRQILGGSLEFDGVTLQAGVIEGEDEFDFSSINTLRYVSGLKSDMRPDDTIASFLIRLYDEGQGVKL